MAHKTVFLFLVRPIMYAKLPNMRENAICFFPHIFSLFIQAESWKYKTEREAIALTAKNPNVWF